METNNQLIVVTIEQLRLLLEEMFGRFLNDKDSPYYSQVESDTKVYSRNEVAGILKKSPNTITKYIRQRKINASVSNRQYYINHTELMKFINKK